MSVETMERDATELVQRFLRHGPKDTGVIVIFFDRNTGDVVWKGGELSMRQFTEILKGLIEGADNRSPLILPPGLRS